MREFTIPTPDTIPIKVGATRIDTAKGDVIEVQKDMTYFAFLSDNIFVHTESMGKKPADTMKILRTLALFEGKKAGEKVLVEDEMAEKMHNASNQDWNQFIAKQVFPFIQATMKWDEKENPTGSKEIKVQKAEEKKPEEPKLEEPKPAETAPAN